MAERGVQYPRAADQHRDGPTHGRRSSRHGSLAFAMMDGGDDTEQLAGADREIVIRNGVAARDEERIGRTRAAPHHSMHDKLMVPREDDDSPRFDLVDRSGCDRHRLTGPKRRDHACPVHAQPQWDARVQSSPAQRKLQRERMVVGGGGSG